MKNELFLPNELVWRSKKCIFPPHFFCCFLFCCEHLQSKNRFVVLVVLVVVVVGGVASLGHELIENKNSNSIHKK